MSVGSAKGLLARARKLERSKGASDGMRAWVEAAFTDALADGRMCSMDGPVVKHCILKWIAEGTSRSGAAGWALPN